MSSYSLPDISFRILRYINFLCNQFNPNREGSDPKLHYTSNYVMESSIFNVSEKKVYILSDGCYSTLIISRVKKSDLSERISGPSLEITFYLQINTAVEY